MTPHVGKPRKRRTTKKQLDDPVGYVVVLTNTAWPKAVFCWTKSGAESSKRAMTENQQKLQSIGGKKSYPDAKIVIVAMADLVKWHDTGVDALEALFALE